MDDEIEDIFYALTELKSGPPFTVVRTRPFDECICYEEGKPYPPPAFEIIYKCS